MRIDGEWYACDDDVMRPVIRGEILNAPGAWEPVLFLVDTGADGTVISAAVLDVLGFDTSETRGRLGGVGVAADSIEVATHIRLPRDNDGLATFRGRFSAVTELEALDTSIFGTRDHERVLCHCGPPWQRCRSHSAAAPINH